MRKLLLSVLFLFISANIFGAELGAGGGSGYPAALDADATPESGATIARSNVPNDLADAIIKIQTELGTDPAGTAATVDNRIGIRSCARVYLSADQDNLDHTDWTKILLDTESFDVGNDFNVTDSSFTVPITGYYQINAQIFWEDTDMVADKAFNIRINKDLTMIMYGSIHSTVAGKSLTINIADIQYLTAGEEITLWGFPEITDATIDAESGIYDTFLSIRFITQ